MTKILFLNFIFVIYACNFDNQNIKSQALISEKLDSIKPLTVNLDDYKIKKVDNVTAYEHKLFENINEVDTIFLNKELFCVKKSKYFIPAKDDYSGDIVLSSEKVFLNRKPIFFIDSILTVSMFELDNNSSIFSFINIKDQNLDNFETTSDLYYINLKNEKVELLKSNLINTVNAPFCNDGSKILFFDDNKLFLMDLSNKNIENIMVITNPYIPYKVNIIDNKTISVIFFKDIIDGKLFEAIIELKNVTL